MGGCDSITYCKTRIGAFLTGEESALQREIIAAQFHVSPDDLEACQADYRPAVEPWQEELTRQRAGQG